MNKKKHMTALKKSRKMETNIQEIKSFTVKSMVSVIDTIKSIDESSK